MVPPRGGGFKAGRSGRGAFTPARLRAKPGDARKGAAAMTEADALGLAGEEVRATRKA